jgi:hypothetical protein
MMNAVLRNCGGHLRAPTTAANLFARGQLMAMEQAKERAHRPYVVANQFRLLTVSAAALHSVGMIIRDFVVFVVVTLFAVMGFAAIDAVLRL